MSNKYGLVKSFGMYTSPQIGPAQCVKQMWRPYKDRNNLPKADLLHPYLASADKPNIKKEERHHEISI